MVKINGLKKAVGDYQRANGHGVYSPWYWFLMWDREDNSVWTDELYSLGHNQWKEYHSPSIIRIDNLMECPVTMASVRAYIERETAK